MHGKILVIDFDNTRIAEIGIGNGTVPESRSDFVITRRREMVRTMLRLASNITLY